MKNIIGWITKKRLMSRWDLDDFELFQIISSGVLPVYLDFGSFASDSELEQLRKVKYGEDIKAESKERWKAFYSEKETERVKYHYSQLSFESFERGHFSDSDLRFKMEDILRLEKEYGKPEQTEYSKKKLRPSQLAKEKCREVAKELWKKYPIRSKEMAGRPEVIKDAGEYTLETRRRWICDLAPSELRKPGRPPKK